MKIGKKSNFKSGGGRLISLLTVITVIITTLALPLTASAEPTEGKGSAYSIKSMNQNYVEWMPNDKNLTCTNIDNYRKTSSGFEETFGSGTLPSVQHKSSTTESTVKIKECPIKQVPFVLPHNIHAATPGDNNGHTSHSVLTMSNKDQDYLDIVGALPAENSGFNSYDLKLVINSNSDKQTPAFEVCDTDKDDEVIAKYTDPNLGNSKSTEPDEIVFEGLTAKNIKVKVTEDSGEILIYSVTLDYHKAPRKEDINFTGADGSYVSGYYTEGDVKEGTKSGVIRFFQKFNGQDVDDYGFVIIDSSANIKDNNPYYSTKINKDAPSSDLKSEDIEGFYGTVTDILEKDFESPVLAKGYVVVDGYTYFLPEAIQGKVGNDNNNWVTEDSVVQ